MIHLPPRLLPCIDDDMKLLALSDLVEEQGEPALADHLRWVAREWQFNHGIPRRLVVSGMNVWARFASQGWSRARVDVITERHIWVEFPHRPARGHLSGNYPVYPRAPRAWWDLEPRGDWQGRHWGKPKARRGYATGTNAALAAALCGQSAKALAKYEQQAALPEMPLFPLDQEAVQ